jgi:anti-sigma factor RsiW
MTDRRFIELLNLYVDDQLDPMEASELEAEVMSSPARRHTYDQYCRLQRGCSLLGDSARSIAPSLNGFARSLREAELKIAAPRRTTAWRTAYAGMFSAAAMAACVVVVVMLNRSAPNSEPDGPLISDGAKSFVDEAVTSLKIASVPPTVPEAMEAFDVQPAIDNNLVTARPRDLEIAVNDRDALEWMQRVELLPLQRVVVDDQTFESRPTLQQDSRVFRSRHSVRGNAEFTAFQFQR